MKPVLYVCLILQLVVHMGEIQQPWVSITVSLSG